MNLLSKESSPYLLQHAHNPVHWYPWGEEAFERARKEDKPVLVSIGYSACHWCHVMERESFEDEQVAQIMNENFINIKVDREERPDVDGIYMDAVQAISGTGGWPLNVFLLPDRRPYYGGTYYPPRRAFNRASWVEVLVAMSEAYKKRRDEVEAQAEQLSEHLSSSNDLSVRLPKGEGELFSEASIHAAFAAAMKTADKEWGGFGRAPKFPQTFTIRFLLDYTSIYGNEEAKAQALLSLDKMALGGIYDQVGGGFARYSTDTEWLAPHFEKMLYDNALLLSCYAEAYKLTGKQLYRDVMEETVTFLQKEMLHPQGGFYAALDADSEGEEGKFYVWQKEEVHQVLGPDAETFCAFYDIKPGGNWEGVSIPRVLLPLEEFAQQAGVDPSSLKEQLSEGRKKLLQKRRERVRPGLDDKILLGWNALMAEALCAVYEATSEPQYLQMARTNIEFLLSSFKGEGGSYHHSWKEGKARFPAFLDDYACLISALISFTGASGELQWIDRAGEITEFVLQNFSDEEEVLFYYTPEGQKDLPVRKKEIYDGATPSGNSVMALNLYRLSVLLGKEEWRARAESGVRRMGEAVIKFPTSFGIWTSLLFEMTNGTREIAILGSEWENYLREINRMQISHKLVLASAHKNSSYPLLADKGEDSKILIYLCRNYACRYPVNTIQEFQKLL